MLLLKVIKCSRIAWDFSTLLCRKQAHFWKRSHPKSDFQWLWQAVHLSTKSAINKPAMNYRTILIAAVFSFVHQVEKDSLRHHTLSAPAISKQVTRRCINFPHELTCQILTNQNIKIGRRAWSTRDSKKLPSLLVYVKDGWIFASEVSSKSTF